MAECPTTFTRMEYSEPFCIKPLAAFFLLLRAQLKGSLVSLYCRGFCLGKMGSRALSAPPWDSVSILRWNSCKESRILFGGKNLRM